MKKRLILLVSLVLPLSSCSLIGFNSIDKVKVNIDSNFSFYLDKMKSTSLEESYQNYLFAVKALDEQYQKIDDLLVNKNAYSSSINKYNEISEKVNLEYFKNHDEFLITLKGILQDPSYYSYYQDKIEDAYFYKNLDENSLFYTNCYQGAKNVSSYVEADKLKEVTLNFENGTISYQEAISSFYSFLDTYSIIYKNNNLYDLYLDLYTDKENYPLSSNVKDTYSYYYQAMNSFIVSMLNSSYKNYFIGDFSLTEEDVIYYLSSDSPQLENLKAQEEELVDEFSLNFNKNNSKYDYKKNYLELLKVRQKIARELGYSNYLEYVYERVYYRDYSLSESSKLSSSVLNNNEILSLYRKYLSSMSNKYLSSKISESQIFSFLKCADNIVLKVDEALLELKNYGNYNFEARSNKYSGSYVTNLDNKNKNYYMFVNTNGNIIDLSTISHEFGHYLGLTKYDHTKKGNTFSLDVCEIHSQGLEYLMTNYYSKILDSKSSQALINYQKYEALWALVSSSAISSFEEYAYSQDAQTLTISDLDMMFNTLSSNLYTNGMTYTDIPHIYIQPGYYISYLVSLIPSLELYAMDLNQAIKAYNVIIDYGETNSLSFVLEKAGIKSPFEEGVINTLIDNLK